MFVSVVIPTYNKAKRLELTLLTIKKQDYQRDKFEVIVVDDGSVDNTREVAENIANSSPINLHYIHQQNKGRAAARNTGIKAASGEVIIFLDDDRLVGADFVKQYAGCFEGQQNLDAAFLGKRMNLYMSRFEEDFISIRNLVENDIQQILRKAREEYYWRKAKEAMSMDSVKWILFTTGNVALKTETLKKAGMFNESFKGWGLEDTELGYRLWKNGVSFIANNKAINYHIEHVRNHDQRKEDETRNHELFYKLHPELPVMLFRKFVYGEISLEEFNGRVKGDMQASNGEGQIFYKMNQMLKGKD